jgi:hypothetical protein
MSRQYSVELKSDLNRYLNHNKLNNNRMINEHNITSMLIQWINGDLTTGQKAKLELYIVSNPEKDLYSKVGELIRFKKSLSPNSSLEKELNKSKALTKSKIANRLITNF